MSSLRNRLHSSLFWLLASSPLLIPTLPVVAWSSILVNPPSSSNHPGIRPVVSNREAAFLHQAGLHQEAVDLCAQDLLQPPVPTPSAEPPGQAAAVEPSSLPPEPVLHVGQGAAACRLLSAASLLRLHRHDDAISVLEPARGHLGVLEPWGALLLGNAHAGAGRPEKAIPLLGEAVSADPGGPLERRAEVPSALALAHAGKFSEARERISALLLQRRGPAAQLRLALAEATEASGDSKKAVELYREIWRIHPETSQADRADSRLGALRDAGSRVPPATDEDRIARAERFVAVGQAEDALAELDALKAPEGPQLALLRARALSSAERKVEAEQALAPALAPEAPGGVRSQALELAARLAMRRGGVDEAISHLRTIPGAGATGREAEFLAAFFLYDAGRFEEAQKAFRSFLGRHGASGRAEEARWYIAWTLYKQGDFKEATAALDELLRRHPKSSLAPQATYWKARALERSGSSEAARRIYTDVARRDPTDFYAILSRTRIEPEQRIAPLESPLKPLAHFRRFSPPTSAPSLSGPAKARLQRAVALYGVGLQEEAGAELDAALEGAKGSAAFAAAAQLAHSSGDHHRAWQWGLFRLGGVNGAADLAYPRAFDLEVEFAARRFGIDPHFVWSIMRQESGFRPRIRSAAAAVGLMQILPRTADLIAGKLGLAADSSERLEDPRVNVTMGAWYLSALLERFQGNHALAAASYNAGPGAVVRWLAEPARKDLPLDEFVESIPYRETRHYVKKVLANHEAYRLIHGGEPIEWTDGLPEAQPGVEF